VLYFQEDYFLEGPVATTLIDEFAEMMLKNEEIKHIGLTHFGSLGPFKPTDDSRLWKIDQRARYRISTQAGLWRVDTLKTHLRPGENGWMFEIFGTNRAWRREEIFLTASHQLYGAQGTPILRYTHTGVIRGRWHPSIPALFSAHGLQIDFTQRGIYRFRPVIVEKLTTFRKLMAHPILLARALLGL
jgi:hypothetical protein